MGLVLAGFLLGGLVFFSFQGLHSAGTRFGAASKAVFRLKDTQRAFAGIVRAVSPAVVNISSRKIAKGDGNTNEDLFSPFSDQPRTWSEQDLGSGVIVSPDGYIITNNHVIAESEDIQVTLLDKRTFRGEVIGTDPKTDLAVLKISAKDLPVIKWGDSDRLEPGDFAVAIGNPFSLSHTATMGIISAVGRANVGIADYEDFIQTDAAINPGNSGGPLVDEDGEVIGINTAIFSKSGGYQGIGCAGPSNMARLIMDQLISNGRVVRGWLGVTMQELPPDIAGKFDVAKPDGVLVSDTNAGGPAYRAGLKRGDIILEFNGKPVNDPAAFKNMVAQSSPGMAVSLGIVRNGQRFRIKAGIGEYPSEPVKAERRHQASYERRNAFAGLSVMDLTRDIARQLGLPQDEKGVVVADVDEMSAASDSGLKRGDVIEEIDKRPVKSLSEFNRLVSRVQASENTVLLLVSRAGKRFYTALKQYQD